MNTPFKVALVQSCASADMQASLDQCEALLRRAHAEGADLVCLAEMFSCLDVRGRRFEVGAHPEETHPAVARFRELAASLGVWVQLGSVAVRLPSGKLRNRALMLDATGGVVARYDKVHMFDVDLAGGESYRESDTFEPGAEAVLAPTPWGLVGLTVCYDLRFAHLYRMLAQAGAGYLTIPAAFTRTTGRDHWHVLLRSRAIETGCYVFAASQSGRHGDAETYGHSLVVDPWGRILADAGEEAGVVVADIDPAKIDEARGMIPALSHDRPISGPKPAAVRRSG